MATVHEQLSEQFATWERQTRGWDVYPDPISPEPPFAPFRGHSIAPAIDDGRRATALSSFVGKLSGWLATQPSIPNTSSTIDDEPPEPRPLVRDEKLIALQASLPSRLNTAKEQFEAFLSHLTVCAEPIAFELIGTHDQVTAQFVVADDDSRRIQPHLKSYFPEATFIASEAISPFGEEGGDLGAVEFGLEKEFLYQIATGKTDPFIGLTAALGELRENESAIYQVIFEPCQNPWGEDVLRRVTDGIGKPLFVNRPEYVALAQEKTRRPLFGVVLRMAAQTDSFERTWDVLRTLACTLRVFANPTGNEFIPLRNDGYPFEAHIDDVTLRQSRRTGMLLNQDELLGLVHLPSESVKTAKFARQASNARPAPGIATQRGGILLGENDHAGFTQEVRATADQRTRHMHIIGASGTGKSTLLFKLIRQDIENGEGVALLDPHGDLVEKILGIIPPNRIDDVILIDPSDEKYSVGFNVLSAHSDLERNLLASDLVSVFQRLSTSWGDQLGSVLQNAILAFLESSRGGTLSDLRRFLIEPKFREAFLETVGDPDIVYYWRKAFTQLSGNKSVGPVITRLDTFLSPKPIRYMVAQPQNRIDFGEVMDKGRIFLAKLPQGQMGKENSFLLGSLLVSKFQQLTMGRQAQRIESRRPFYLYIDEFQNFITPSMAEILSGARKYRLGLILAHQELRQLERDREVASAVLSNPYTRIVFRVGDSDARALENGFAHFEARDLQNLETGSAICRMEKADHDFNLSVSLPEADDSSTIREAVIVASRKRYATPRAEVETLLRSKLMSEAEARTASNARVPSPPVTEVKVPEISIASPPISPVAVNPIDIESPKPPVETLPPNDLGRGGEQHRLIQKRIKQEAEALGFRVIAESPILDRSGSVDLVIDIGNEKIAVEITITTTIDHEVGNISKCLRAGFNRVAAVSPSEKKLEALRNAVHGALGKSEAASVSYFSPDEFLEHLRTFAKAHAQAGPTETKRRGYKVTRAAANLTPEELKAKEHSALRLIAEALKQKGTT